MANNGKSSGQKHFQREDHEHAAHQQEAKRQSVSKGGGVNKNADKRQSAATGHPMEETPRGPKKGQ